MHNLLQSQDIRQNSDKGIFDFWLSGESLLKENWHNSRTSDDVDMKLDPVTKLDKETKSVKKVWGWRNFDMLWRQCQFANLEQSGN